MCEAKYTRFFFSLASAVNANNVPNLHHWVFSIFTYFLLQFFHFDVRPASALFCPMGVCMLWRLCAFECLLKLPFFRLALSAVHLVRRAPMQILQYRPHLHLIELTREAYNSARFTESYFTTCSFRVVQQCFGLRFFFPSCVCFLCSLCHPFKWNRNIA